MNMKFRLYNLFLLLILVIFNLVAIVKLSRQRREIQGEITELSNQTTALEKKAEALKKQAEACGMPVNPASIPACPAVKLKPPSRGCRQVPGGMDCQIGAIPPTSWGDCIEADDSSWRCLLKGQISMYKHGPDAEWTHPASDCPDLAEQLRKYGKDHVDLPPIVLPVEPNDTRSKT